jgi:hypothetical protein
VSFRRLTAALVVAGTAAAVLGLTGCGTKIGTAAVVGGHRITDSDVSQYLTAAAKPFSVQSQSGAPESIIPRSYTLTILIQSRLFSAALAETKGGVPSEGELSGVEDQLTQGASEEQQQQQYVKYGFEPSFAAVDLRNTALEQLLAQRLGVTNDISPLLKAVHGLHAGISVSPRYGVWDARSLSLDSAPTDGLPSFVTLHPTSADAQAG